MALVASTARFDFNGASLEVSIARGDWAGIAEAVQRFVLDCAVDHKSGENLVEWIHAQLQQSPLGPELLGVALQMNKQDRFVSARTCGYLL